MSDNDNIEKALKNLNNEEIEELHSNIINAGLHLRRLSDLVDREFSKRTILRRLYS